MPELRSEYVLYHAPGACSRVVLNALEEIGLDYLDRPINIFTGEQTTPEYLAVNPKGKVPALVVASELLTETPAIAAYLANRFPEAELLPGENAIERFRALGALMWCSNTLHPLARALRVPHKMTDGDPAPVRRVAAQQLTPFLDLLKRRLEDGDWWLGSRWSIVDVYLSWVTGMCRAAGFDMTPYARILAHEKAVRSRPSFIRALVREEKAAEGAAITLPGGEL